MVYRTGFEFIGYSVLCSALPCSETEETEIQLLKDHCSVNHVIAHCSQCKMHVICANCTPGCHSQMGWQFRSKFSKKICSIPIRRDQNDALKFKFFLMPRSNPVDIFKIF